MSVAGFLGGTLVYRNQIAVDHRYANAGRWHTEPLVPQDPNNPRNRRIAVTILRNDAALRLRQNGRADTAAQP